MTTAAELEAAIVAAPLDPGPRMVYGDWLQAKDDPTGQWIAMMAAIEAAPRDVRLRSAALAFLATNRMEILGPISDAMAGAYVGWRGGFVDEVRMQPSYGTHSYQVSWRAPLFRFVRHVAIGAPHVMLPRDLVDAKLPLLDSVVIMDAGSSGTRVNVDQLAALPALRSLTLNHVSIGTRLPQLRELVINVDTEHTELTDWLARGTCPALEALTLLHTNGGLSPERIVDIVRACPELRELRLIGATRATAIATLLRHVPTKLRLVDMSHSDLDDRGVAELRRWQPQPEVYAWCTNVTARSMNKNRGSRPHSAVFELLPTTPRSWLVDRLATGGRDAVRMVPTAGLALYNLGSYVITHDDGYLRAAIVDLARQAIPYLDASATLPVSNYYSLQLSNAAVAHERALELDEAELRAREALLYMPRDANFHAILIDALRRTGRVEEAAAAIPAALVAIETPTYGAQHGGASAALNDCLVTLGTLGRYRELVDTASRRYCVAHINAASHAVLAIAHLALGDRAAADTALAMANKVCTKPIIHHARAAMFAADGKADQARAAIAKAREAGYTEMAWIEADPVLRAFAHAKPAAKPKPTKRRRDAPKPQKKRAGKKPTKPRHR